MFTPFNSLPDHSRIWIFQATRKFNAQETTILQEALLAFTERWSVHGVPLRSSFDIRFDQYIILFADENSSGVSGCSIDDSVRIIKGLGQKLSLDFFDRTLVGLKKEDDIITIRMTELQQKYHEGLWDNKTLITNNLISTKGDLESQWLVPAELTWLKRYLPRKTVVR